MSIFAPDEIREKRVRFSQESIRWELQQMICEIFETCISLIISTLFFGHIPKSGI